jgi:hypothetical protein
VEQEKTVLIVIDGTDAVKRVSDEVSAALDGYQAVVRTAESFAGTDLLPAHAFLLGCGTAKPASFSYIAELLSHINLSGRPCGVFSPDKKALHYLSGLVKDSGAVEGEPLLLEGEGADASQIQDWVQKILQ